MGGGVTNRENVICSCRLRCSGVSAFVFVHPTTPNRNRMRGEVATPF